MEMLSNCLISGVVELMQLGNAEPQKRVGGASIVQEGSTGAIIASDRVAAII